MPKLATENLCLQLKTTRITLTARPLLYTHLVKLFTRQTNLCHAELKSGLKQKEKLYVVKRQRVAGVDPTRPRKSLILNDLHKLKKTNKRLDILLFV